MAAAIPQKRENDEPALEESTFDLKQWLVNPKTPKLVEHFNGQSSTYRNWASKVKAHLMASNLGWGKLLEVVEKSRTPLTKTRLASLVGIGDAELDLSAVPVDGVRHVRVSQSIGDLTVVLPAQASARVTVGGGLGDVVVEGDTRAARQPGEP